MEGDPVQIFPSRPRYVFQFADMSSKAAAPTFSVWAVSSVVIGDKCDLIEMPACFPLNPRDVLARSQSEGMVAASSSSSPRGTKRTVSHLDTDEHNKLIRRAPMTTALLENMCASNLPTPPPVIILFWQHTRPSICLRMVFLDLCIYIHVCAKKPTDV